MQQRRRWLPPQRRSMASRRARADRLGPPAAPRIRADRSVKRCRRHPPSVGRHRAVRRGSGPRRLHRPRAPCDRAGPARVCRWRRPEAPATWASAGRKRVRAILPVPRTAKRIGRCASPDITAEAPARRRWWPAAGAALAGQAHPHGRIEPASSVRAADGTTRHR